MDLRKVFLAGMAVATLASCSEKDDLQVNEGNGFKVVSINVENKINTKTATNKVTDKKVNFNDGRIYFVNPTGGITDYYDIVNDSTDVDPAGKTVGAKFIKGATSALEFSVPESSDAIYVFGNVGNPTALVERGNISLAINGIADLESQRSMNGDVSSVYLYGKGDIVEQSGVDVNPYKAYVVLAPIAARMELGGLEAKATSSITSYKVEGVFINYFYTEAGFNGKADESKFVAYTSLDEFGQTQTNDPDDRLSTYEWYHISKNGLVHDWASTAGSLTGLANVTSAGVASPVGTADVWAYNLLVGQKVPHIVIKLTDVESTNPGIDPNIPYYITVRNFKDLDTGNRLTSLEKGNVYHIASIPFDEDNLDILPEMEQPIDVDVTIKVMDWVIRNIGADFE